MKFGEVQFYFLVICMSIVATSIYLNARGIISFLHFLVFSGGSVFFMALLYIITIYKESYAEDMGGEE